MKELMSMRKNLLLVAVIAVVVVLLVLYIFDAFGCFGCNMCGSFWGCFETCTGGCSDCVGCMLGCG